MGLLILVLEMKILKGWGWGLSNDNFHEKSDHSYAEHECGSKISQLTL